MSPPSVRRSIRPGPAAISSCSGAPAYQCQISAEAMPVRALAAREQIIGGGRDRAAVRVLLEVAECFAKMTALRMRLKSEHSDDVLCGQRGHKTAGPLKCRANIFSKASSFLKNPTPLFQVILKSDSSAREFRQKLSTP